MAELQGQLWKMLILFHRKGNINLCGFIFKSLLLVSIELFSLVVISEEWIVSDKKNDEQIIICSVASAYFISILNSAFLHRIF